MAASSACVRSSARSSGSSRPTESRIRPVADAERRALLLLQPLMRRRRRMRDEALRVAEIVGDLDDLKRAQHVEGAALAALHVKGDHGAGRRSSGGWRAACCGWLGVARDSRALDRRMLGEHVGDLRRRFRLPRHPHLQRLERLQQHPGIEGAERGAGVLQIRKELFARSTPRRKARRRRGSAPARRCASSPNRRRCARRAASGRWKSGVEKTLSTMSRAPASRAISATAAMSISSSVGFDGLSRKNALVSGLTAFRHASRSRPSISVEEMPKRGRILPIT